MRLTLEPTAGGRGIQGEVVAGSDTPRFDPSFVRRPRLVERLLGSPPARVVLLAAPAGYSKSTCLAEWAAADKRPFAWIAVDASDDDRSRLIASIVEALDRIEPTSAGDLPRLGRSLRARARPFVLVVDGIDAIGSPEALEVLATVIECLPAGSQLALASRTEPPLALGRLRAHRQLVELRQAELAMTRAESGELVRKLGIALSAKQIDVLFERTEGWPAALYLAGLALADQPQLSAAVASFAGDDRIVVDYLRDEFLAAADPATLSFLTRSSVLDELSGPLCDAVLERSGSAELLRDLARSNYPVEPRDRNDGRYRYRRLFAEMLRSELRHREPEAEAGLHERASRWYAAHSDPGHAVEHAIAAGDVERAGELIWLAFLELSGRGKISAIGRWLDAVGDERIASSGPLALVGAHCRLLAGDGARAAHWARVAAAIADSTPDGGEPAAADIHLLDAALAIDGVARMGRDAARASELLPPESAWQAWSFFYRGVSGHLTGHPERAHPLLQEAARRGAAVSPIIQVLSLAQLCVIAIEDEDWALGSRLIAQAREQLDRCGLGDYPSVVIAYAASALARSHRGKVEPAQADVADAERLLALLSDFPSWYEAETRLVLSRACARLDDLDRARALLEEASKSLQRTTDATILAKWLERYSASLRTVSAEGRGRKSSLTGAELRTLQYLPSHLSFREIGGRIHVSPNTVKTQAQAAYRKLGASSRAEAVEMARDAGLLGEDSVRAS